MKKNLYFLGIKGSGMSGLATLCHDKGYNVVGSDTAQWFFSQVNLDKRGIEMFDFNEDNIKKYVDYTFICGDAFNENNNVEMKYIIDNNLNFMRYHDFVGMLTKQVFSVGIAGCHGKTTTTNMFNLALNSQKQIQYIIGDGSGKGLENPDMFLVEADEYRNHFLNYNFEYSVVTNIDFDHPDFFNSIDDMCFTFETFINNTAQKAIVWGEDKYIHKLDVNKEKLVTYGFGKDNDFIVNIKNTNTDGTTFEVINNSQIICDVTLPLFGQHMILNAASCVVFCHLNNLNVQEAIENLKNYKTPKRRFDIYEVKNQVIIDDYAHHPAEIKSVYDSIKQKYKGTGKEIIAVHMPFTYSRTKSLFSGFVESLQLFDKAYITPIYASPRENVKTIDESELIESIQNSELITLNSIFKLEKHENAVIAFMSCGNIKEYVESYKEYINGK